MPLWAIIGIAVAAALIAWVLASMHTRRKDIRKVAYMMDALEDGELNFRFQDKDRFNRTLNRIRTIFEKQRQAHEQDSWTKLIRVLTHEITSPSTRTAGASWTSRRGSRPSPIPPRTSSISYRPTGSFPAWRSPSARRWSCRN